MLILQLMMIVGLPQLTLLTGQKNLHLHRGAAQHGAKILIQDGDNRVLLWAVKVPPGMHKVLPGIHQEEAVGIMKTMAVLGPRRNLDPAPRPRPCERQMTLEGNTRARFGCKDGVIVRIFV